jgi:putative nucleotidyltransferase with HDIG domain
MSVFLTIDEQCSKITNLAGRAPMNKKKLVTLKKWFDDYCDSFTTPSAEDQRNITVKRDHTHEVCLNAAQIAKDLRLDPQQTMLAEAIALFHDVGRFPQYRQFKTFDDSISVNHAALGAKVLLENNVLRDLDDHDQNIISRAVTLHNVLSLPEGLDKETLLFSRLIRDADKLDILRVVIEYFQQEPGNRADAVALGLPDHPGYSEEVLSCVYEKKTALKSMLTTQNDFKLLQLTWVYDLNFDGSLRMVATRNYIPAIAAMLPRNDDISRAVSDVRGYVDGRLQAG